jgi:hypothetical protein
LQHEQEKLRKKYGVKIEYGYLKSVSRFGYKNICPFQTEEGFCELHRNPDKPFNCITDPFTLNPNGTLIIRNYYRLMRCFRSADKLGYTRKPAYKAYRFSLKTMFGEATTRKIVKHLDTGDGNLIIPVTVEQYNRIAEPELILHFFDKPEPINAI